MRKQQGFTLIEIAIVLVIIGLLLGGVLKGQELINAARVRNIAAQLDGVKIAYLGFQDRYRQYPGDVTDAFAAANIPGAGATGGCGTAGTLGCNNGKIDPQENLVVWNNLSHSGFISGSYNGIMGTTAGAFVAATSATSPANPYGGFPVLVNDTDYGDITSTTPASVLNVKTGGLMPIAVVVEVDRKVDDGAAGTGSFRTAITYGGQDPNCITGTNGSVTLGYANIDIKSCNGVAIQ